MEHELIKHIKYVYMCDKMDAAAGALGFRIKAKSHKDMELREGQCIMMFLNHIYIYI